MALEESVLKTLQFSVRYVSVPFFLERFRRIFDLDLKDPRSL